VLARLTAPLVDAPVLLRNLVALILMTLASAPSRAARDVARLSVFCLVGVRSPGP